MKNTLNTLVLAGLLAGISTMATAESTSNKPHDQHPESTKQGDYLKDQPGESNMQKSNDAGSMNKDGTQKGSMEKGKSHKEKPGAGGVDVNGKY